MRLKIKTKTTLGSSAFLLILTIISTITVTIIINKQNRKASHELLKKSFTVVNEFVSERQNKLLIDSRQMATINDMSGTVSSLINNKETFLYVMLRTSYTKIAESIHNISMNANIQKAFVYDANGNLIAFSMLEDDGASSLGFLHDKDNMEAAFIERGKKFHYELWKKQDSLPNIDSKYNGEIPVKETIRFENINDSISLVSYIPIMGVGYNREKDQDEQKQYGFLTAVQAFDDKFIKKISRVAGTAVKMFTNKGLSLGNLDKYTEFDLSVFDKIDVEWSMNNQEIIFNLIEIDNKDYFQGVLPIYSGSDCIAAIASLHSKDIAKANTWQMMKILILVSTMCILVLLPITVIFSNSMSKPIIKVVAGLKDVAEGEGDLTARLDIKNKDEVGDLSHWFNTFMDNLHKMIRNITGSAETLNLSSSALSGLSQRMSDNTGELSAKTYSVAASSEEMSTNMNSVAATMEEASNNVGMVATSAEEMTATINEISLNSEKARTITSEAVSRAQEASAKVDELGNAAKEIGKVTETITEISEQTNLLALNATIEAARAGEAGKGFSVVANEIKELARQTAEATQEIKEQISGIQTSTSGTVLEIEEILKVINIVNEIVAAIATAVEEQSLTTNEIANNVSQAAKGIQEVNENVAQSSTVSTVIAKEITDVNQAIGEMSNSGSEMNLSASELSKLAEELKDMVSRFKV